MDATPSQTQANLKGVRGWLGFLVLGFCVLGPLVSCGQLSNDFMSAESADPALTTVAEWVAFKSYSHWALGLALVISFSAGYRLWKIHNADSVRFAIGALWLIAPIAATGYYAAAYFAFGSSAAQTLTSELVLMILQGSLPALIWTMYLLRSRRVRNTYYQTR